MDVVAGAAAALFGAVLGAGAALHVARRQRVADRSLAVAEAVGQLCGALSATHYRTMVFRTRFPKLGGLLNSPPMTATVRLFDSLCDDLAVAVREHSRIVALADRQEIIDAAHAALDAMQAIVDLAIRDDELTPDDWEPLLARLGTVHANLKREVRAGFRLPGLRIVAPQQPRGDERSNPTLPQQDADQ